MRQVRTIRYRDIAEELRAELGSGTYAPGQLLPSESDLSTRFGVSRVTIRKALELLRADSLIDARQGFGWFVAGPSVPQPLARLATIEAQLTASGVRSERRILDFAFVKPPARVRDLLQLPAGAKVLKVGRINLADGVPFARVTVWCPEELGSAVSRAQVTEQSFYDLLPVQLGGARQTIEAAAASEHEAEVLAIPVGSPVLRCERVTADADGRPVLIGEYTFPGHRTAFTVDLPHVEASIAPSGLRLVE